MATKIVATGVEARADIIREVERLMTRGAAISGYTSDSMVVEFRGMKGVVADVARSFVRAGKATWKGDV
jgi:hypothetical protein